MRPKQFIPLPIALLLVLSISGCTGIELPIIGNICIPGLTCTGSTTEYENDVLIIKTLDAIPQTISTGQQMRLSAWITNNGGETVPQKVFAGKTGAQMTLQLDIITVELYDTCEGLFESVTPNCPSEATISSTKKGCIIKTLLPKQTIPVSWSLVANKADKIPLETPCNLKVYVRYPYQTKSMTSISFVDYTEYQRMLDTNTFKAITSYITEGYGPIKPYLTVEDTQPIPVERGKESTTSMAFQIKNKGSGVLSFFQQDSYGNPYIAILNQDIKIQSDVKNYDIGKQIESKITEMGNIQFVNKESPKQTFAIKTPSDNQIEKIATYYVTTSVDYMYEFRKEIKVTIKPPKITG